MSKNNSKQWNDLVLFDGKGIRRVGQPNIRILKGGTFIFNVGLVRTSNLKSFTHTILRYSKSNKALVFKFVKNDKTEGALKITQRTKEGTGNASITSRSFFTSNSLDLDEYKGKYEPVQENIPDIGKCWVIYLDQKEQ